MNQEKFRKLLLAEKEDILSLEESGQESTQTVELDQTTVGRLSRMDAMQQQQMALASERQKKIRLDVIDRALKRIDDGDYGYCTSCDEGIPEKRLELDPATAICVKCLSGN